RACQPARAPARPAARQGQWQPPPSAEYDSTMRIGIVGAGMIGGTLARRLVTLGHTVTIANSRGPETLAELASETCARAATPAAAVRSGEIVVVTIPQGAVPDLPKDLFAGVPADVVVIDTGNYYPSRDGSIPAID